MFKVSAITCVKIIFISIFLTSQSGGQLSEPQSTTKCDPLKPTENVVISCHQSNSTKTNCKDRQPVGTLAKYQCKTYYIPYATKTNFQNSEQELKCKGNGGWTNFEKFDSFECYEDCGKRLVNSKPLIVHGVATNRTVWPWHAAIFRQLNSNFEYICGGTLIRNRIILTAAHCVSTSDGNPMNTDVFRIFLGAVSSNYSENLVEEDVQEFMVRKIYISENYDAKKDFHADIAILHLRGQMTFNDHTLPICLPNDYAVDINAVKAGKFADIVGFGVNEHGVRSKHLRHASLQIMTHAECFNSLKQRLTESQICAGNQEAGNFTTVCNGDSGGGLVYPSSVLGKYHIHGIVSTGDSSKKPVCQNYGVFTRVFQFISWVRDVLEQINGYIIRELAENVKYPLVIKGFVKENGEIVRVRFLGIPRDWDSRILTIQLVRVEIDPSVLIDNLEYTKHILALNLTQINFDTEQVNKRVRLPYLETFILDHMRDNSDIKPTLAAPFSVTKEYIKSLLFFDKDYDEYPVTWPIESIMHLKTNIELTLSIFKLITINHEGKMLSLSQLPFYDEILENLASNSSFDSRSHDYQLVHLSLNDVANFDPKLLLIHKNTLEHLILNNVKFSVSTPGRPVSNFNDVLKQLRNLTELRIVGCKFEEESLLFLTELPFTLKQLVFAQNSGLTIRYDNLIQEKIRFPTKIGARFYFPNLEDFTCEFCELDSKSMQNFHWMFQKVKKLTIKTNEKLNVMRLVDRMEQLEWIHVGNDPSYQGIEERTPKRNFYGLHHFLNFSSLDPSATKSLFIEKSSPHSKWSIRVPSQDEQLEEEFAEYGLAHFWTSREEYQVLARLNPNELIAKNTGHYRYNGSTLNANEFSEIRNIPTRLKPYLTTIEISNAKVVPEVIAFSIRDCDNLESIELRNVKLQGLFDNRLLELPNVKHYHLSSVLFSHLSILPWYYLKKFDDIQFRASLPFEEFIHSDGEDNGNFLDYAYQLYDSAHLTSVEIIHDACTIVNFDKEGGLLISIMHFTTDLLYNFMDGLDSYPPMKNLALRGQTFNNLTAIIPETVIHLNLDYNHFQDSQVFSELMTQTNFTQLKDLRLAHNFVTENGSSQSLAIDLGVFNSVASTIEFLEFNQVRFNNSDPNFKFGQQLKSVYFETCELNHENTTLIDNFWTIFPAKKIILIGNEQKNVKNDKRNDWIENILLNILRSPGIGPNTKWIRVRRSSISTRIAHFNFANDKVQQLEGMLSKAGVPSNHTHDFTIVRSTAGKWEWLNRDNSDQDTKFNDLDSGKVTSTKVFGRGGCEPEQQELAHT